MKGFASRDFSCYYPVVFVPPEGVRLVHTVCMSLYSLCFPSEAGTPPLSSSPALHLIHLWFTPYGGTTGGLAVTHFPNPPLVGKEGGQCVQAGRGGSGGKQESWETIGLPP
jgi:hypothetical protein